MTLLRTGQGSKRFQVFFDDHWDLEKESAVQGVSKIETCGTSRLSSYVSYIQWLIGALYDDIDKRMVESAG